jgi:hypothetical protein
VAWFSSVIEQGKEEPPDTASSRRRVRTVLLGHLSGFGLFSVSTASLPSHPPQLTQTVGSLAIVKNVGQVKLHLQLLGSRVTCPPWRFSRVPASRCAQVLGEEQQILGPNSALPRVGRSNLRLY